MKYITILSLLLLFAPFCLTQIPIDQYKEEIKNLSTEAEIQLYWKKLYDIDQNILVFEQDVAKHDSISIDLMIRTTLLFQIHDTIGYNRWTNTLPVLNLSHSYSGFCQIIYWPIIEKCSALGGVIENLGGIFPAYELESVSLSFYYYSLLYQESKYPLLSNKLKGKNIDSIVPQLLCVFDAQKKKYKLKEQKLIGSWFKQPFTTMKEDSSFEILLMNDGHYYIQQDNRLQKLIQTKLRHGIRTYRIEDDPFGWFYRLDLDGDLELFDENGTILISYTKSTNANTK